MLPNHIQKRISHAVTSPQPKDYIAIAKDINHNLGYTLFDTQDHLKSQFDLLARLK